ncbi:LAMI_0C01288g1_1 [Lachancea mirantina]|uniref:LAMI_0C01288g1_1 n=1 Tax=Lachancea mirantina TaxID=1230905 RepID=A0A1G4J012_9SACH|nr:LAMI_0C01288g1_1 [Lachancea mirantina]
MAVTLTLQRGREEPGYSAGITTVWLLSSLGVGRSSASSKVKKKDIVSVSIPQTCKEVERSSYELPLRQVSNLLYGVTLCFERKTEYVLADVTAVKLQLHRQLLGLTSKKINEILKTKVTTTIYDGVHEYADMAEMQRARNSTLEDHARTLLGDDPSFDINFIREFSSLDDKESKGDRASKVIRRHDIMHEAYNGYENDAFQRSKFGDLYGGPHGGTSQSDEMFPLDVDLELDFGDVLSDADATSVKSGDDQSETGGSRRLNFKALAEGFDSQGFDLIDLPDLDSHLPDQERRNELLKRLHDSDSDEEISVIQEKKRKQPRNRRGKCLQLLVLCDDKIALSTEDLRTNDYYYRESMRVFKDRPVNKKAQGRGRDMNEMLFSFASDQQIPQMAQCYRELFPWPKFKPGANEKGGGDIGIERGRQNARSRTTSRSSSVLSAEQGRRMSGLDNERRDEGDNAFDMLPGLGQIDEEFNEEQSYHANGNLLDIDFHLPPSSFGRSSSRMGTDSRDHIEELRTMNLKRRSVREPRSGSTGQTRSDELQSTGDQLMDPLPETQNQILDHQSKRFLDYMNERACFVGRTSRSHPKFHKKILFEDIIPSRISEESSSNTSGEGFKAVSKSIACNAFLALLQLASKSFVDIRAFAPNQPFATLNGDDLVIYLSSNPQVAY